MMRDLLGDERDNRMLVRGGSLRRVGLPRALEALANHRVERLAWRLVRDRIEQAEIPVD